MKGEIQNLAWNLGKSGYVFFSKETDNFSLSFLYFQL